MFHHDQPFEDIQDLNVAWKENACVMTAEKIDAFLAVHTKRIRWLSLSNNLL